MPTNQVNQASIWSIEIRAVTDSLKTGTPGHAGGRSYAPSKEVQAGPNLF